VVVPGVACCCLLLPLLLLKLMFDLLYF